MRRRRTMYPSTWYYRLDKQLKTVTEAFTRYCRVRTASMWMISIKLHITKKS